MGEETEIRFITTFKPMETQEEAKEVCLICKRTAYITKCKGCIYNVLNSKNKKDDTMKRKDLHSMWEMSKKNWEKNE